MAGGWILKLTFCLMETTHESLHLYKQWKIKFCVNNYFLGRTFWIWRWWDFQTTAVNARLAPINVRPLNFVCRQFIRSWTTFNKTTSAWNQKYEHGGLLKVKMNILSDGDNSWTFTLRQTTFGTMKDNGHAYKFYLNNYFFIGPFEYSDAGILTLLTWMKNLHQSTWDHEALYADRSSKG
jgi:hypothetical protein